jgi:4-amino-4-deoxy-L-arabinose transferase-like glycosyltransferase
MLASGDWIVPRQQGTIFPERPPLGSWAMALVGMARGQVDLVAIRLPSVLATLLLSWVIYAYARAWMSRRGAFAAGVIYITFGQVLPLGRLGESEALFTLFVAGALLIWHGGYLRGRSRTLTWSVGYGLAGLGALVKGPQAPVYFFAACVAYLVLERNWRWLVCRGHAIGVLVFAAVVGAWMVPFCLSDLNAVDDIWAGLARERFTTHGLVRHLASYPLETLGCLLPWSPLLFWYARPSARRAIFAAHPAARFLVVALLITYPSVWIAAHARGRYFMPLYPCAALLAALVIEHCTSTLADAADRRMWRRYVRGLCMVVAGAGAAYAAGHALQLEALADARQSNGFLAGWMAASLTAASLLWWAARELERPRPGVALAAAAAFIGLSYTMVVTSARDRAGNDLEPALAALKQTLPAPEAMVSLGRVSHRFAYSYNTPIRQLPWPNESFRLPEGVEYFCYDVKPGYLDPPVGGSEASRPGTTPPLPFAWELVGEYSCDPVRRPVPHNRVVVGRMRRTDGTPAPIVAGSANQPGPR